MPTLNEFSEQLALEAGEDFNDPDVATQFRRWVQEGINRVVRVARFLYQNNTYTLELSAGVGEYTLSPNVSEVVLAWIKPVDESVRVLQYVPQERLVRLGFDPINDTTEDVNELFYWYYSGVNSETTALQIRVYPTPAGAAASAALVLRTLDHAVQLAGSANIPLPTDFLVSVRDFVRAMVFFNEERVQEYQVAMQAFHEGLIGLATRYTEPSPGMSRLKVSRLKQVPQAPAASHRTEAAPREDRGR